MTRLVEPAAGRASTASAELPFGLSWPTWMGLLVAVAAAIRIVMLVVLDPQVMETEGQCYVRIAENLVAGHGSLGIRAEGAQLFYPPLYPLLLSILLAAGLDGATSAHVISLVCGALLVIPIAWVGRAAFSGIVGVVAGFIIAAHPALVITSISTLGESLYFLLIATAVAAFASALQAPGVRTLVASGAFAGLAYLVRPEGLIVVIIGAIVLAMVVRGTWAQRGVRIGAFTLAFLAFAAPYVGYLAWETGRFMLETKSPENMLVGSRVANGDAEMAVYFGIDSSLAPTGTSMMSNLDAIEQADLADVDKLQFVRTFGLRNLLRGVDAFSTSKMLGQPVLGALAFLGLFASAWPRRRLEVLAIPLGLCAASFVALLTLHLFWVRYLFPVLPWLAILAAAGLITVARTVAETTRGLRSLGNFARLGGASAAIVLFAAMIAFASRGTHEVGEFSEAWSKARGPLRVAGERIRGDLGRARVVDVDPTVAYYARAIFEFFPYTDAETAVRYLDSREIDYLVLRRDSSTAPYLKEWYRSGPPPEKARPLFDVDGIRVYRWMP